MMQKFGPGSGRHVDGAFRPPRPDAEHEWIDGAWRLPAVADEFDEPDEPETEDQD
jgi:hypothetical protein